MSVTRCSALRVLLGSRIHPHPATFDRHAVIQCDATPQVFFIVNSVGLILRQGFSGRTLQEGAFPEPVRRHVPAVQARRAGAACGSDQTASPLG